MPQILISWVLCVFLALFLSTIPEKLLKPLFPERKMPGLWIQFWIGLAFLSILLSIFTFFHPLSQAAKAILWLSLLLAPFLLNRGAVFAILITIRRKLTSLNPFAWLLFILCSAIGLIKAAGRPEIFDEGAYHLPLIRMWEQKGIVIGFANLNGHYGLHSAWHLLSAFTSLDFIPGFQSEMSLNGLLASLLGLFSASRLNIIISKKAHKPVSAFIACLLPFFLFRNLLSSPGTDIPAITGSWFLFMLWLEALEKEENMNSRWDLFLVLPVWVVSVKSSSSGLLIAVVIFVYLQLSKGKIKRVIAACLLAIIPAAIWILQNWLISGYGLFPIETSALGHPEWQVPVENIRKKFYLEQFGAFAPPESYNLNWLKIWFGAQNPDSRFIIFLAGLFFILFPIYRFSSVKKNKPESAFYLLLFLQTAIWFFTITEPRYGFGALVISALYMPAIAIQKASLKMPGLRFIIAGIIPLMAFNTIKTYREYNDQHQSIMLPAKVPGVKFSKIQCGNFEASCPETYTDSVPQGKPVFCWDCPFPCFPLEAKQDASKVFMNQNATFPYFYFKNLNTSKSKSH